ncbi:hypothetical protein [Streptomyces sp. NPDC059861]|uniref:hypothetical protein n=1 Tax=Streptomyces sp. NPDC059861 TaxID=3346974 RepID=UPI00364F7E91
MCPRLQVAGPRGDLLVHWFRTALDRLLAPDERVDCYGLVTESISGGHEVRVQDVRADWPVLADALRPLPFSASAGFHQPSEDRLFLGHRSPPNWPSDSGGVVFEGAGEG